MARSKARLLVVVVGLVLPSLVACDAIIGLSDFKKGECSGGGACLDEAGPPIIDAGGGDADATADSGRGAEAVSWARWPMPNYPSTDAGAPLQLSPTDNNTTVSDDTRHLVWQANGDAAPVDFATAASKCTAIAPTGQWRLPKRIELVTLLDFSQPSGFTNPAFKNVAIGPVWTSSEFRTVDENKQVTVTTQFWVVSFGDGSVTTAEGSSPAAGTLCVKAQ